MSLEVQGQGKQTQSARPSARQTQTTSQVARHKVAYGAPANVLGAPPENTLRLDDLRAARWFTLLLFVAAIFVAPLVTVHADGPTSDAERTLFDAANRERISQGLQPLHWDEALAAAAREHAMRMAQRNTLSHQLPGELPLPDRARVAGAHYSVIAENVAEGPSAEQIHSGWMHSPPHRANLLDPNLGAVGISVVAMQEHGGAGGGILFAVQDFSRPVANLNLQDQERQVGAQLAARGLQVLDARSASADDARKTCGTDRGWTGNRPSLVVRYESPDLNKLPQEVEQKLESSHYRTAAVGACETGNAGNFTRFRIAILLF
jgi:uncharacterized protein YkwD